MTPRSGQEYLRSAGEGEVTRLKIGARTKMKTPRTLRGVLQKTEKQSGETLRVKVSPALWPGDLLRLAFAPRAWMELRPS